MEKSEVIANYADVIQEEMVSAYERVVRSRGSEQIQIYIWEDGKPELLSGPCGDNSRLQARDNEPRELYYVTTVVERCFDPWDLTDHSAPEDDAARETEEDEIIAWAVDEYRTNVSDRLDAIIADAKDDEERFDREYNDAGYQF